MDEYETTDADGDVEWVEVDEYGGWRPSIWTRLRAGGLLLIGLGALLRIALSFPSGGPDDERNTAIALSTTTTEAPTTTTTEPPAPSSIDGEPPSLNCFRDDRDARPLREPAAITVMVLNGTRKAGHAGALTDVLQDGGYTTLAPDNAGIRSESSVSFQPGYCAEAEQVAQALLLYDAFVLPTTDVRIPVPIGGATVVVIAGPDSL